MFLTDEELYELTGWRLKKRQVEHLRRLGIPFFLNRHGEPRVPRTAIEGGRPAATEKKTWEPAWAA